jgi:hypothetical protein
MKQDASDRWRYVDTGEHVFDLPESQHGDWKDNKEAFSVEQDLRKEYNAHDSVKAYNDVRDAYEKVRSAAQIDSGPGDMSLIFGYMKMIDPGSTVREGEFATAEKAGGVSAEIRNIYNKALTGERLTPDLRRQFVESAEKMYSDTAQNLSDTNTRYGGIADSHKLPRDRILVTPEKYDTLTLEEKKNLPPDVELDVLLKKYGGAGR